METRVIQNDKNEMRLIYKKLLEKWNSNNAAEFAGLFASNANVVGFDGSVMNGRQEIEAEMNRVFSTHKVASFVGIVKEVRTLATDVFLLRAVAGMVPPGEKVINPALNAIQALIGLKYEGKFCISLFQNTPAAFHERPEKAKQLTLELQEEFNSRQK
jgi:uncharacterized protein (TIGR02246 family)